MPEQYKDPVHQQPSHWLCINRLLMPEQYKDPVHQQPSHWLCINRLLMPEQYKDPVHQQPSHWLCINRLLMPEQYKDPVHQQPSHWLCINRLLMPEQYKDPVHQQPSHWLCINRLLMPEQYKDPVHQQPSHWLGIINVCSHLPYSSCIPRNICTLCAFVVICCVQIMVIVLTHVLPTMPHTSYEVLQPVHSNECWGNPVLLIYPQKYQHPIWGVGNMEKLVTNIHWEKQEKAQQNPLHISWDIL